MLNFRNYVGSLKLCMNNNICIQNFKLFIRYILTYLDPVVKYLFLIWYVITCVIAFLLTPA
jgi:hypothetical protein